MPSLGKTQAEWTSLFREFMQYVRLYREIKEFRRRYIEGRIRTLSMFDTGGLLTSWAITGAKRGINVSEDGRLWLTVTDAFPGAGSAKVELFMDVGKATLVATAIALYGALGTITPEAGYDIGGTVRFKNPMGASNIIILALDIDEGIKGNRAFDTGLGGTYASRKYTERLNLTASSLAAMTSQLKSDIETNFIKGRLKEFLKSPTSAVFSSSESVDSNGDTVITKSGLLQELYDDMEDEAGAGGVQAIDQNTVSAGAPAYDADNDGVGVLTAPAVRGHAPVGRITIECTAGSDTTLQETFDVALQASDGRTINGNSSLIIDLEWENQTIGARLLLSRTITDLDLGGQVAVYVVDGESLSNTDAGDIYQELEAGVFVGGNRRVNWYSDSTKLLLVARGERTGNGVVTMVEENASGLSGLCTITYAGDDLGMIVYLNPFSKGDLIIVDIANDRLGRIQTLFSDIWGMSLPSAAAPSKLADALIKEGAEHIADLS